MATSTSKTRSGNPAKKAAAKQAASAASSAAEFKKRKKGGTLPLPSGLSVVARRVELRTFLKRGDVPNSLLEIVEEALNKGGEMDPKALLDAEEGSVDMDMVEDMYDTVDLVVIECVINPKVHPLVWTAGDLEKELIPPDGGVGDEISEEDRDENTLYIDEFDDEDKMFLFQWATGGTADIATFRKEASASLDALAKK